MTHRPDRRISQRQSATARGILSVRVRPGHDAWLVNVCTGGALIETAHRLLPGCIVDILLAGVERSVSMRGRVMRSTVARLRATSVWYRAAICFDRRLPCLARTGEYEIPTRESRVHPAARADASLAVTG